MKEIELTKGQVVLFDEADTELVEQYSWSLLTSPKTNTYYAYDQTRRILMHNLLMNRLWIDHINHNGLDNRRSNLRYTTPQLNGANRRKTEGCSSKYKGVSLNKYGKYVAYIRYNYKRIHLGCFVIEEYAAIAYDIKAYSLFGKHAHLNFPENDYEKNNTESNTISPIRQDSEIQMA